MTSKKSHLKEPGLTSKNKNLKTNIEALQKEMLELGVIDKPLTIEQIKDILNNPFVKYSYIFMSENLSDDEHEEFKEQFSKDSEYT